jgi:hypothetical protein
MPWAFSWSRVPRTTERVPDRQRPVRLQNHPVTSLDLSLIQAAKDELSSPLERNAILIHHLDIELGCPCPQLDNHTRDRLPRVDTGRYGSILTSGIPPGHYVECVVRLWIAIAFLIGSEIDITARDAPEVEPPASSVSVRCDTLIGLLRCGTAKTMAPARGLPSHVKDDSLSGAGRRTGRILHETPYPDEQERNC